MKKYLCYFSGTHWDREWYQTFQGFRFKLDRMMRSLIEFLEQNEQFRVFYLDGQTIVLEDFLEISPSYKDRLAKLIRSGRIVIGPWYCMPDEFLVSGEALIRNFLFGREICEQFQVKPMQCGYICDIFGHIAQFPQILAGFGFHTAVLGRGTRESTTEMFFRWQSPDGTECLVYKVPDCYGYGSFAAEVSGINNKNVDRSADDPEFLERCKEYIDREIARSNGPVAVIMDAMDHEPVHKHTAEYLRQISKMYPDREIVHGNLEKMFELAAPYAKQVRKGELIETAPGFSPYLNLITNILSSRYDIKSRNDRAQDLLEKWLEPLIVYLRNGKYPVSEQYLKIAWKNLLQNHPHDSICGCSVDRVHQDMQFRFSQVESITEAVTQESLLLQVKRFAALDAENNTVINIFSMNTFGGQKYLTLELPFVTDYPSYAEPFGYESVASFLLFAEDGREIPYRIEKFLRNASLRVCSEEVQKADVYTLTFAANLQPFGCTRIFVKAQEKPVRFPGGTADSEGNLENACLKVQIEPDGRISLTDKRSGKTYSNLCGLLDDSEIGDGWFSVRNKCGELCVKTKLEAAEVLPSNFSGGSVRVVRSMEIPAKTDIFAAGIERSGERKILKIESVYTLNAGEDFVRVKMLVHNSAKDHRLRLHLPTDTGSDFYYASQNFAFVKRKAGTLAQTLDFKEPDPLEKNMQGILLRTDAEGTGLAFLSKYGLHEAGCDTDPRSSMYVTLFRSFSKTHTTNGQPDGQLQGVMTFEFLLKPYHKEGLTSLQNLQNQYKEINSFVITDGAEEFPFGEIRTEGNCVVSALKPSVKGRESILRVYNVEQAPQEFSLSLKNSDAKAYRTDLDEKTSRSLVHKDGKYFLKVDAYKILTIKIKETCKS